MSYLNRVKECNTYHRPEFVPFIADSQCIGWIKQPFFEFLGRYPEAFTFTNQALTFSNKVKTVYDRSMALAGLAPEWVASGWVPKLLGETYPARQTWASSDYFQIDRALVPLFGIRAYGVHLNGYVKKSDQIHLWVGVRSADRMVEPGKLDNMVAGGQPVGLSLRENLIKECDEEASLPAALANQAKATGTVSYCFASSVGLKVDTLFCYDLAVPEDFVPKNQDGEISGFQLMPIQQALSIVRESTDFKFNVSLVILDFAIRHGVISPDSEPDYENILTGLHMGGPSYNAR